MQRGSSKNDLAAGAPTDSIMKSYEHLTFKIENVIFEQAETMDVKRSFLNAEAKLISLDHF